MTRRVHYAWVVLALCFGGLLAAQGVRLAFGAFIDPWQEEFGVGRGTITSISLLGFLVYGACQPFVGGLVGRYGVRRTFPASVLLVAAGMIATAFVQSPLQLAFTYGIVASIGFGGASGVGASVAATEWFSQRRGLAFGLLEAGFGAGQLLLVPAALVAIELVGWRTTAGAAGVLLAVVVAPILAIWLRSKPSDMGVLPYGGAPDAGPALEVSGAPGPQRVLWRSWAFWGLAAPFFVCGVTTTGLIDTHLIPFAHDHGYSTGVTGTAVGLLAAANIAGTLASGPIADRFDNRHVLAGLYSLRALSLLVLLSSHQQTVVLIGFAVLFGLVDFATVVPTQVLASRYFDGHSVGVVFGLLLLTHQIGSALGAWLPGVIFDRTGSYDIVFAVSAVGLVAAAIACVTLPAAGAGRLRPLASPGMAA